MRRAGGFMAKYYYQRELNHTGLNKYKVVKAETQYELAQKVAAIQAQWDEQWKRKCELERDREEKERIKNNVEKAVLYAEKKTKQVEEDLKNIDSLLGNKGTKLIKENLYDMSAYKVKCPTQIENERYPIEPKRTDTKYNEAMPFLTSLFKKKKEEYIEANNRAFENDFECWKQQVDAVDKRNEKNKKQYDEKLKEWKKQEADFKNNQAEFNAEIDRLFADYEGGKKDAIEEYFITLLNKINLPLVYNKEIELEYIEESKMLIIDLILPNIDDFPRLKKVTYVKSSGSYKETYQSEAFMKKLYDKAIYDIVLLFLYDTFQQDQYNVIKAIVINGKLNTIDKTTGNEISPYILSVNISKEAFAELNIDYIDSREWFKSSKGISAATFAKITPVAPVITISHEDSRFVDGYDFTNSIDESVNLAAIDWQDFENLIREVFAEEFQSNGGEVKITQASRDGGVDAVAFDPDPIRGGKIVIQAKRYTNVVGVSAVRDLYGTVMNEGATKGILVTTSNYGNDAYEFAKGKPLTLMNGANLLYLLEKHGHRARINLAEAKDLMKSNSI